MVVILLNGGLGNQMFQYSLYRKLQSIGKNVEIDDNKMRSEGNEHNGIELARAFGLKYRRASLLTVHSFNSKYSFRGAIRQAKKLLGIKLAPRGYKEDRLVFNQDIYEMNDVYLWGYWQSWKYFYDIRDDLLREFSFRYTENERNDSLSAEIQQQVSVSIHVRRGDYLRSDYAKKFGGICTIEYYKRAVEYIEKAIGKCRFYIFTDDPEWTSDNMNFIMDYRLIDWNRGNESYMDMFFMSKCSHNIIANSSFSWWGAWLNCHSDKIVIAPSRWSDDAGDFIDTVPDEWVRL